MESINVERSSEWDRVNILLSFVFLFQVREYAERGNEGEEEEGVMNLHLVTVRQRKENESVQ